MEAWNMLKGLFNSNNEDEGANPPQTLQNEGYYDAYHYPELDQISVGYAQFPNYEEGGPSTQVLYPNTDTEPLPTADVNNVVNEGWTSLEACALITPKKKEPEPGPEENVYGWAPLHTGPKLSTPPSIPEVASEDYTSYFKKGIVFESRDEGFGWIKVIAEQLNFCVVKYRNESGEKNGQTPRLWIACERRGFNTPKKEIINRPSKRCGCKFMIILCLDEDDGFWKLWVRNGVHNHLMGKDMQGFPIAGKLTPDEKGEVRRLYEGNVKPAFIRHIINKDSKDNVSGQKQIYNAINKIKQEGMEKRTVVQEFFYRCKEAGYFMTYRYNEETTEMTDIFFAHPESIRLLKAFPYVIEIDSTYATNVYNCPFMQVVGVTSTWLNFNVCGAFLSGEKGDNYEWAMQQLRMLFERCQKWPQCIVTDREKALMNACQRVFSSAQFLLCRRHVRKNIEDYTRRMSDSDMGRLLSGEYYKLFKMESVTEYDRKLKFIYREWKQYGQVHAYVKKEWLGPYRERLCSAWTDSRFNLAQHTTNRVEGAHSAFKSYLHSSTSHISQIFGRYHIFIDKQVREIKATLNHSMQRHYSDLYSTDLFAALHFNVSHKGLRRLAKEYAKGENVNADPVCKCTRLVRDGLPCYHVMGNCIRQGVPIPLDSIHPFWRTLCIYESEESIAKEAEHDANRRKVCKNLMDDLIDKEWDNGSVEDQMKVIEATKAILLPQTSKLRQCATIKAKGRPQGALNKRVACGWEKRDKQEAEDAGTPPKKSKGKGKAVVKSQKPNFIPSITQLAAALEQGAQDASVYKDVWSAKFIAEYILGFYNIVGDGNCGFRSIAQGIGRSQHDWIYVRRCMVHTLRNNWWLFKRTLEESVTLEAMIRVLDDSLCSPVAPMFKWFTSVDEGLIAATTFGIILVVLGRDCSTYPPLALPPDYKQGDRLPIVCLGHLEDQQHWILLELSNGAPLPPVFPLWRDHAQGGARQVLDPYLDRITDWQLQQQLQRVAEEKKAGRRRKPKLVYLDD